MVFEITFDTCFSFDLICLFWVNSVYLLCCFSMKFFSIGIDIKSSPYFYSKKYLKHFIMELIEVELKVKAKLKVAIMIPPTLRPSAAWGSWGGLSPEGVWRDIFELPAKAGSQGLAWAPCPGQLHSGPHSPELPAEDLPVLKAQDGPPPRAPGCCGHRVGGIIIETFSFACNLRSIAMSFMMKCLRYFLLEILKKTVSPKTGVCSLQK